MSPAGRFTYGGRSYEYAGLGRRAVATLLDNLVWIIGFSFFVPPQLFEGSEGTAVLATLVLFTAWFNYFAICEWRFGQTIGKNAVGLRVLPLEGGRLGWNAAAIRNVLRLVDFPLAAIGLGIALIQRSPRRQRLGDRAAKTIVVRDPEPSPAQPDAAAAAAAAGNLPEPAPPRAGAPPTAGEIFEDAAEALGSQPPPAAEQPPPAEIPGSEPSRALPEQREADTTPLLQGPYLPYARWGVARAFAGLALTLLAGLLVIPLAIVPFEPEIADGEPLSTAATVAAQGLLGISLAAGALLVAGVGRRSTSVHGALASLGIRPVSWRAALKWTGIAIGAYFVFGYLYLLVFGAPEQEDIARDLGLDSGLVGAIGAVVLIAGLAPVAEELFFRGMFFGGLRTALAFVPAALISGAAFGLVHATTGISTVIPLTAFGFLMALIYERTGSLVPGIVLHAINNSVAVATA